MSNDQTDINKHLKEQGDESDSSHESPPLRYNIINHGSSGGITEYPNDPKREVIQELLYRAGDDGNSFAPRRPFSTPRDQTVSPPSQKSEADPSMSSEQKLHNKTSPTNLLKSTKMLQNMQILNRSLAIRSGVSSDHHQKMESALNEALEMRYKSNGLSGKELLTKNKDIHGGVYGTMYRILNDHNKVDPQFQEYLMKNAQLQERTYRNLATNLLDTLVKHKFMNNEAKDNYIETIESGSTGWKKAVIGLLDTLESQKIIDSNDKNSMKEILDRKMLLKVISDTIKEIEKERYDRFNKIIHDEGFESLLQEQQEALAKLDDNIQDLKEIWEERERIHKAMTRLCEDRSHIQTQLDNLWSNHTNDNPFFETQIEEIEQQDEDLRTRYMEYKSDFTSIESNSSIKELRRLRENQDKIQTYIKESNQLFWDSKLFYSSTEKDRKLKARYYENSKKYEEEERKFAKWSWINGG